MINRCDSLVNCASLPLRLMDYAALLRCTKILTPSLAVANALSDCYAIDQRKIHTIHNGCETPTSSGHMKEEGSATVGTIGNVRWEKGYEVGLKAIKKTREKYDPTRVSYASKQG